MLSSFWLNIMRFGVIADCLSLTVEREGFVGVECNCSPMGSEGLDSLQAIMEDDSEPWSRDFAAGVHSTNESNSILFALQSTMETSESSCNINCYSLQ